MMYKTISFYKYVSLSTPEVIQKYFQDLCQKQKILGRILVAKEGINGAVSGSLPSIEEFQKSLQEQEIFSDLTYREQITNFQTYHTLRIKIRSEIVHFGVEVNLEEVGMVLSPAQLEQWYQKQEDFIIVDARNEYEYKVGHFRNALKMPIHNFREFPAASAQLEQFKDKKIVLYCTGGVRCEKASAYLKQQGFPQVYQVQGGIINYVNQFPQSHWEGGLFVFDDRLVSDVGEPITDCLFCHTETEQYYNCHNLDCDQLFIACPPCAEKNMFTCSVSCQSAPRQRKITPAKIVLGTVENYYAHAKVGLVKVTQPFSIPLTIEIAGKTTQCLQTMTELRDEEGNSINQAAVGQLLTFPVKQKIRKNDTIYGQTARMAPITSSTTR